MADINIENFYQHIARILNILYSAFPTKQPLYVDEVAGIDEPDEYGLHSPTYTAGFFAMIWLAEEDFLRYADTIRQDGVDQAILTHKAFLRLTAIEEPIYVEHIVASGESGERGENGESGESGASNVVNLMPTEGLSPSVLEERKLVINQLRGALRSRSSIAITKVVRHILRQ